jgi:hypothetical protein
MAIWLFNLFLILPLKIYGIFIFPIAYFIDTLFYIQKYPITKDTITIYPPFNKIYRLLWITLDDTVDKKGFIKDYLWGAWRNSCVNFWNLTSLGHRIKLLKIKGNFEKGEYANGKVSYYYRSKKYHIGFARGNGRFECRRIR